MTEGAIYILATHEPEKMLAFLKTGGVATVPYYKSVCPKGHRLYSNVRMAGYECPHGGCGTKIVEEHFYDLRTDTAWPAQQP